MGGQNVEVIHANVVLRYLVDDGDQATRAGLLLQAADQEEKTLLLPDLALADIVWVLETVYKTPRPEIRDAVSVLLSVRGLKFSAGKALVADALALYAEKNIDWSDAFIAAQMTALKLRTIYSFDKDFDRIPGIQRIEPMF
ncbi:MAG: PIN domain-containing protein [Selenomonadales bacterium]|nr:PIN domain-containing protein [Selenomonadales bacterium]